MSQEKKTALLTMLFVYTVICGIIIADLGTSSVAGSTRKTIIEQLCAYQAFSK